MVCVQKNSVYAFFIGFLICIAGAVSGKGDKDDKLNSPSSSNVKITSTAPATEFQWKEHKKLSWEDFKGVVNASDDESAAATHCGMGFRINGVTESGKHDIVVYNIFYTGKSWVRSDAKISSILNHEQGHFDLCEIYTRKLTSRINTLKYNATDMKQSLLHIFSEVNNEYETCQQAYEYETTHGTNVREQKKWQDKIDKELSGDQLTVSTSWKIN